MDTYISQQKTELLVSLENQVHYSQLVAVIVGAKGVGKSFLIDQLQLRIEDKTSVARIDASLAMTPAQLDQAISLQLGLSWDDSSQSLEQRIKDQLEQKVSITIDDAHLLSEECLNYLLKLNQDQLKFTSPVLFVLLSGDHSLPAMIENTSVFSLHHDMCVVLTVEAIDKTETQAMVASLGHCDFEFVDTFFDEKKLHYFWQLSKGNPAELDYHISRWIEENNPVKQVELAAPAKGSMIKSVFYLSLVVILSSVLVYQKEINHWVNQKGQVKNSQQINKTMASKKPKLVANSASQISSKDLLSQQTLPKEILNLRSENSQNKPSAEIAAIEKAKTTTDTRQAIKPPNIDKRMLNPIAADQEVTKPAPQQEPVISVIAKTLNSDERWLLAQSSRAFALQWVGVSQQQSALAFIAEHPLASEMKIYRRATLGKVLFLVVSGHYRDRKAASDAIKSYRQGGFSGSPWVKPLSAIQTEIKAFQSLQR